MLFCNAFTWYVWLLAAICEFTSASCDFPCQGRNGFGNLVQKMTAKANQSNRSPIIEKLKPSGPGPHVEGFAQPSVICQQSLLRNALLPFAWAVKVFVEAPAKEYR